MASVTARIAKITQPRGGYIKPSEFKEIQFDDCKTLGEENIHASIVGMAVDYLTRFMLGIKSGLSVDKSARKAFEISLIGYERRVGFCGDDAHKDDIKNKVDADYLISRINGLDIESIISACRLSTYDVWFRSIGDAMISKGPTEINPDNQTVENIKIMVDRSLSFWDKYGPVVVDGFTFEKDGYTSVIDSGDGDFLTIDTMWDFKVTKSKINNKHTLQLLIYWIMGNHSKKPEFSTIDKLGVFNPKLNAAFVLETKEISKDIITEIENDVICYK